VNHFFKRNLTIGSITAAAGITSVLGPSPRSRPLSPSRHLTR
jgi:hypothetical protein